MSINVLSKVGKTKQLTMLSYDKSTNQVVY